MRRRNFVTVLASAAAYPLLAGAQQKPMPVIGFLGVASPPSEASMAAFRQGLSETGYIDDKTWRSNTAGRRVTTIGWRHWRPISSAKRST